MTRTRWILLLIGLLAAGCESAHLPPGHSSSHTTDPEGEVDAQVSLPDDAPAATTDVTGSTQQMSRSDAEWREILTPEQYHVLREKGTERPYTNEYDHHFEEGVYACAACGQELFGSDTKFNSGCGWPAFYAAQAGDRVTLTSDRSHGMVRTEVTCTRCGSHLGHIFDDAPQTPTGQRYCINSVSLKFIPSKLPKKKKQ
jgi:peptide-methionine (R)-S-oxide reductase